LVISSCHTEDKGSKNKIDFNGISETIKPGDNFFEHVNKTWLDTVVIADDQAGVGSYSFLNIPQKKLLENILTEVSASTHKDGSIEQCWVIFMLRVWIPRVSIHLVLNP